MELLAEKGVFGLWLMNSHGFRPRRVVHVGDDYWQHWTVALIEIDPFLFFAFFPANKKKMNLTLSIHANST